MKVYFYKGNNVGNSPVFSSPPAYPIVTLWQIPLQNFFF